ncbi:folylpolyglutamate synthase/dihydrofolate synthase family protein [Qipengyuania sp. RANM35]|uniref:bifunctional folylpolyglutamate synthase/dihydrofolate synthase n=1 Tax=Qipengyuania sp. RANM35 TaxID=3068635 RepID=UPI0034DB7784
MRDFARSDSPAVQEQLDRLGRLSVPEGRLGLDTIRALLARLGDPHKRLPPVFHVAGTNGKGSTCAFLRAMLEAQGCKVHATISPHLVRYNERIRVAGELISDEGLAELLAEVLDAGEDLNPSFFEVTIAAAFAEFARVPADACVVEVGLGGRFDATNVLEPEVLAACGIAALGIDHERFLLAPEEGVPEAPMARIAFEKAGIAKSGVPLITLGPTQSAAAVIFEVAERVGAPIIMEGVDFQILADGQNFAVVDADSQIVLPLPSLSGAHQVSNAGLAVAMLHNQRRIPVGHEAMVKGVTLARWPARLQLMKDGPLTAGREVWLDGGHNPSAGQALANHFRGQRLHLVIGMLSAKDPGSLVGPLGKSIASITVVPVPGHEWHSVGVFGPEAQSAGSLPEAFEMLPRDELPVLVAGSLYLAGEALRLNDEFPD